MSLLPHTFSLRLYGFVERSRSHTPRTFVISFITMSFTFVLGPLQNFPGLTFMKTEDFGKSENTRTLDIPNSKFNYTKTHVVTSAFLPTPSRPHWGGTIVLFCFVVKLNYLGQIKRYLSLFDWYRDT